MLFVFAMNIIFYDASATLIDVMSAFTVFLLKAICIKSDAAKSTALRITMLK